VSVAWSEHSYLGLSWQHTRGSALLGLVHDDTACLANQIQAHYDYAALSAMAGVIRPPST
jgi:hypothetical protein